MLSVDLYVLNGHPARDIIAGTVTLDSGKLSASAAEPRFEKLVGGVLRSHIVVGDKKIEPSDPENWITNLHREYRSYALRASKPYQVEPPKNFSDDGSWPRPLTKYEQRCDFKAIKAVFDDDPRRVDGELRAALRKVRDALVNIVTRADKERRLNPQFIASIKLDAGPEFQKVLGEYLLNVWRKGRDLALQELPIPTRRQAEPIKNYEIINFGGSGSGNWGHAGRPGEVGGSESGGFRNALSEELDGVEDTFLHGTDAKSAASIKEVGIAPKVGDFIRSAYGGEYEAAGNNIDTFATPLVYLAPADSHADAAMSAMQHHVARLTGKDREDVTSADVERHGALVAIKGASSDFVHITDEGINSGEYPDTWVGLEPGDVVSEGNVSADKIITGTKLSSLWQIWRKKFLAASDSTRKYDVGFAPLEAINYFLTRALILKGVIDDELAKKAKLQLLEHLKGGRPLIETIGNLRDIFEPWVGDPTKIGPSGQVGIGFPPGESAPENILMAYRLENIIRTETTNSLAQGRLAVADASRGFVIGFLHSSIIDPRTTETCLAADGLTYSIDDAYAVKLTPPLHWMCRSIQVFVTTDDLPVEWSSEEDLARVVSLIPIEFK
jgi:SPP1 gp7 family putative phage head morphogenesis protein